MSSRISAFSCPYASTTAARTTTELPTSAPPGWPEPITGSSSVQGSRGGSATGRTGSILTTRAPPTGLATGGRSVETREHFYIDGGFVPAAGTGTIDVVSPHTEEVIARVPDGTTADIDRAVAAARKAFDDGEWTRTTPAERAVKINALSAAVASRLDESAKLISSENGSPYSWSIMGQVLSSQLVLDFYGGLAESYPFEDVRTGFMGPVWVRKEPV